MPLIEFINDYDRPLDIARNLKSIYYDFVDYVVREGECGGDIVADNLYVFRRLVGALEDMQNPDEDRVMVIGVSGDGFSFDPKSQKL